MEELLEQLSNDPDSIGELSREDLVKAQAALTEAGREQLTIAKDTERSNTERREALEAVAEAKERLDAVTTALAKFEAEDSEIDAEAEALADTFAEDSGDSEEEDAEDSDEDAETEDIEDSEDAVEDEAEEAEEKEDAVVASKPSIGRLAKRNPPRPDTEPAIVASAGPLMKAKFQQDGYRTPLEVGAAALEAWKSYGSQRVDARALVASWASEHEHEVTGESFAADRAAVDAAVADYVQGLKAAHADKSLVATGGIIAPTPPVYDFYSISERAGMVAMPTVAAPRGRIEFPTSPSYATIRASGGWEDAVAQEHTNANDVAGASKSSFQVTDPGSATCTVSAWPVILQYGNFQQRFYPEFVAHTTKESLVFHDHFVNGAHIVDMVAAAAAQVAGDPGGGSLTNLAHLLSFYAARYRDNFRMSPTAILELVSPAWVVDALAADLVARDSTQEFGNMRSRVLAVFSSLGLNVQLVQDWQSIGDAADDGYPDAADFLLFAPGTFVRLDGGTLDLGIVRDSTLNATNDFQTFTESFEIICEVGHESWAINDISICPTGGTGNRVALVCPGFAS